MEEVCESFNWGYMVLTVLAAWFRLKYPHVTIGALASSSPILLFENITSPYAFNNVITQDFRSESENCYKVIKGSWQQIEDTANQPGGLESLVDFLYGAFVSTAETDYPTPSNFLSPMPAYPVKQEFEEVPRIYRLILAVYEDDLRHPQFPPSGGYRLNPDCVIKRLTYQQTHGNALSYIIYLDHHHREIALAIRGLNLIKESDYKLLLDNGLGYANVRRRVRPPRPFEICNLVAQQGIGDSEAIVA
ncbi:unnamed protein product [Camellia sinensis]